MGAAGSGAATTYAAATPGSYATVADVNGDGTLDALYAPVTGGIVVSLGNNTGGFSSLQTTYATGGVVHAVTAADVNLDGHTDLIAVQGTATLVELLGTAAGGYTVSTLTTLADPISALTTADLNRDGKPDLIGTTSDGAGVDVLYGNGSGGFSAPTTVFGGRQIASVLVADVNGDGIPDLVGAVSGGGILIALGSSAGGFATPVTFAPGGSAAAVATADLNQDGQFDLVTANSGGGATELLNTSTPAQTLDPGSVPDAAGADTGLVVETASPTVTAVTSNLPPITYGAGTDILLTVTFSQIVGVTGGDPTLSLSDGGAARYISGSGTNTLVFEQSVAFGENTANLAVTGSTGASFITDLAGNQADLSLATGVSFGIGIASGLDVTQIKTTPASGTLGAGAVISVALTVNTPVVYSTTGTAPHLTLNDGGVATYQGESANGQTLSFAYTVKSGDNTSDLMVTGLSQPSSTFSTAGNGGVPDGRQLLRRRHPVGDHDGRP